MKSYFSRHKTIIIISAIIVVILVWFFFIRKKSGTYQFVTVTQGTITEIVSVTGNTTPVQSLDLAFQNGGTIAAVYKNAGDTVSAGDVLATLDTSDLAAQLAQAKASVDAAQATLQNLQAGPTPQNVEVSQAAVTSAQQTLNNSYTGIQNAVISAFAKANDAVRNQITPFYTSPESNNPQLTFTISDNQVLNNAQFDRLQASEELNEWQQELNMLALTSPTSTLEAALTSATNHLAVIENLLTTDSTAIVDATNLNATTATEYKTDISNAVTEVDTAANSISTISQSIASEEAALSQAQAQLNVTLAGSTAQEIAAQQAQVEEAQANEQGIQVKINEASLVSPINGVVTVQNAKVGQIAPAGQTITSIISNNNLEIDADVPETDIGKVNIGDVVDMTFDAFPGQNFTGKVFYIDPAQTIISGVVDYEIKVSLDKPNPNIKSGLTANLNIETQTDANALILPQYAILDTASGTYVDVLQNNKEIQVPVTLGIQDQLGNVEVTNGVTAGEQVINIGLKAQ
jgi:HlyD family secretion protein